MEEQIDINNNKTLNPSQLPTISIDGSILEGGGQILRISITLAILFKREIRIFNIRANRSTPGLQRQHLASVTSVCEITQSKLEGAKLLSKEIKIVPGELNINTNNTYKCDCNGAGSIGLLIQQILPIIIFAKDKIDVTMTGGTIVSHAPSTFYINEVLKFILNKMNVEFNLQVNRHGIFPVGMGNVKFQTNVVGTIKPINLTQRGKLIKIIMRICSTQNFKKISEDDLKKEIVKEMKKRLYSYYKKIDETNLDFDINDKIEIEFDYVKLYAKKEFTFFVQINLYFENTIITVENLYSEKKENDSLIGFENKILEEFEHILNNEEICLDEYTVDHLIIFMALAEGKSKISLGEISKHTLTAIEVVKQFIPELEYSIESNGKSSIIEIEGIGFSN